MGALDADKTGEGGGGRSPRREEDEGEGEKDPPGGGSRGRTRGDRGVTKSPGTREEDEESSSSSEEEEEKEEGGGGAGGGEEGGEGTKSRTGLPRSAAAGGQSLDIEASEIAAAGAKIYSLAVDAMRRLPRMQGLGWPAASPQGGPRPTRAPVQLVPPSNSC